MEAELDTLFDEIAVAEGLCPSSAEFDSLLDEIAVNGFYTSTDEEHTSILYGNIPSSLLQSIGKSLYIVAQRLKIPIPR